MGEFSTSWRPSEKARSAVLVRTHAPTPASIERILEWSRSAKAAGAMFAVSVDTTAPAGRKAAFALLSQLGDELVHTYDGDELANVYPVLERECRARVQAGSRRQWQRWGACPREGASTPPPPTLAWCFHTEAINLWAQRHDTDAFEACWVLEDDVGFTGDLLNDFCLHYDEDSADLISLPTAAVFKQGRNGRPTLRDSEWCWAFTGSDAFLQEVPPIERVKCGEHVQRFSRRFLDELHHQSSWKGMTAWSEMASPSLCRYAGFHIAEIRPEHIGHTFSFAGRISRAQWSQLQGDDAEAANQAKLFHALKW